MIKEKLNNAIVAMKRNHGCPITYAFLTEEDFVELKSLSEGEPFDDGYVIWSMYCYPYKSLGYVNEIIKSGPNSISGRYSEIRGNFEDIRLVSIKKSVDFVRDQDVSEELYDGDYILVDEIKADENILKNIKEMLSKFSHPFLIIEVFQLKVNHIGQQPILFKIKFKGKYQHKEYIDEYRFFILNFLNKSYNLNVYMQ